MAELIVVEEQAVGQIGAFQVLPKPWHSSRASSARIPLQMEQSCEWVIEDCEQNRIDRGDLLEKHAQEPLAKSRCHSPLTSSATVSISLAPQRCSALRVPQRELPHGEPLEEPVVFI